MSVRALIVPAGGANYGSLVEACRRVGVDAEVGDDAARIGAATHLILPGVGAAAQAMRGLRERGLERLLRAATQPLLGICLGMQLLFEASDEVDADTGAETTTCLGLLRGRVRRLAPAPSWPHMGWNRLDGAAAHPLLAGIDRNDWFYFVHGYAAEPDAHTLAATTHGTAFAAVIASGNVFGTQFHPEKSAASGRRVLANFFALA